MKIIFYQFILLLAICFNVSAMKRSAQPVVVTEETEVFLMSHPAKKVASPHYLKPGITMKNKQMYERYKKAHAAWLERGEIGPRPELIWLD